MGTDVSSPGPGGMNTIFMALLAADRFAAKAGMGKRFISFVRRDSVRHTPRLRDWPVRVHSQ